MSALLPPTTASCPSSPVLLCVNISCSISVSVEGTNAGEIV